MCCHLQSRYFLYESGADRLQSELRPGVEPVYGCTIHQSRKLPCTCPQCEPDWGETQDDLVDKEDGRRILKSMMSLNKAGIMLHFDRMWLNVTERMFQTLSCLRILSIKKLQQLSLVSMSPNPLSSIRIDVTIISTSSSLNRSGISPK